jgi:hypothetical protein
MSLTAEQRMAMPESAFAVPGRRALPITDARHVRMAWGLAMKAEGMTAEECAEAKTRILAKAAELGIDPAELENKPFKAQPMRMEADFAAMALAMPAVYGHPNRMPFSGILTRLDSASDRPPGGAGGKRVILTRSAADRALPSLLGMGVNYVSSQDGHDVTQKIGVITAASIEGDAIHIDGFIYAKDFPEEASRIQTDKRQLGFSWELADIYVERLDADPLVITEACFTGAAILRKDKAAYSSTSLAASAEDPDMTKEEMQALLADAIKPVASSIAEIAAAQAATEKKVADMAAAAEVSAKSAKEAADKAATEAKDGELASLKTKVADLEAAAAKKADEPARKTFSPQIAAMLAKADLTVPGAGEKLSIGAVDVALSKTDLSPVKRMEIKNELQRAGAL